MTRCATPTGSVTVTDETAVLQLQARLDAALDALAECRKKRDYHRAQAGEWRENYYKALRGEHVHDVPMEESGDE